MLPEKPWKGEAVARLTLSLFVCLFLGISANSIFQRVGGLGTTGWQIGVGAILCLGFGVAGLINLRRPWETDRLESAILRSLFFMFGTFFASIGVQVAAGKLKDPNVLQVLIGSLSIHAALLIMVPGFLRRHQVSWREAFGLSLNWKMAVVCGVLGVIIFLPVGRLLQIVSVSGMSKSGWQPKAQTAVQVLADTESWQGRVALAVITIILAPLAEEVLFRGILYPFAKRLMNMWVALWLTAILFALIHWNPPTFLPLLLLAVLLARLYETTRNLLAPIVVHVLFNAVNFTIFYGDKWLPETFKHFWSPGLIQ